jgi:glycosyltransferase involved in cell wall biosynthesis
MISVIILTKNEEKDLPKCLDALQWADDIHVLDSYSTDKTIEIVRSRNIHVAFNQFRSFGAQRNFALENLALKYDWILFLDADEIVTDGFKTSILKAIKEADQETAGFYCCWKMMLENTWLKHCDNFPKWQFRLLKKGRAKFTDFGHGQKEDQVNGKIEYIKEPYLHYGFSKGWFNWIERHNKYSTLEAQSRLFSCPPIKNIFSGVSSIRNPALKSWLSKIPGWPVLRFIQSYVLNLGFLEGGAGFIYCTNMAYYEFLIQIKIRELKRQRHL